MHKGIKILIWIVLPLLLLVAVVVAFQWNRNRKVETVEIALDHEYNEEVSELINTKDVEYMLAQNFDSLKGKTIKDLELEAMEKALEKNPYVKSADAYVSLSANLFFRIQQRQPIVRVIDQRGEHYYIDNEEHWVPTRSQYPVRVLVCNGAIPDMGFFHLQVRSQTRDSVIQHSILHSVYLIAKYVNEDAFLRKQIVQMNVDAQGNFFLIPLVGNLVIEFGKADKIAEKFDRLNHFYQGLGHHKWNNYREINVKFENQIVCTKI
jgi:cell division protein FtsQ